MKNKNKYAGEIKPILDFILALLGIIILSPIFILISVILFFMNRGKVFFFQWRIGKDGKLFKMMKFKTMNDQKDKEGNLLPDENRLTKIGRWVRNTSLDELPQLINVLKGEMSLIGPRPMLPYYMDLYNDFQKRRNEVKPGISGWAQVNGRNRISWQKKFEYDVWYVDHVGFLLDLKIIFLTFYKVLLSEGVNEEGCATSGEFEGNDE